MPYVDPEIRFGDFFFYGLLTGISLVIVVTLLMWWAARWEIAQVTSLAVEELRRSERELAARVRKFEAENEALRTEIRRLRGDTVA